MLGGFYAVLGRDEDVVWRIVREFAAKCVGVGDPIFQYKERGLLRSFGGCRYDFDTKQPEVVPDPGLILA